MIKRISAVFFALLICVVCTVTAFAVRREYTLSLPEDYVFAYTENGLDAVAKVLDTDAAEYTKYCKEKDVDFVAVSPNGDIQLRVLKYETELSKNAESLSSLTDSELDTLSKDISASGYAKTSVSGTVFLKSQAQMSDSRGEYTSVQYITVANGCVYQFSFFVSQGADPETVRDIFSTVRIGYKAVYTVKQKIILIAVLTVLALLIILMIRGIVNDIKQNRK